jgi:hypothetical protein
MAVRNRTSRKAKPNSAVPRKFRAGAGRDRDGGMTHCPFSGVKQTSNDVVKRVR